MPQEFDMTLPSGVQAPAGISPPANPQELEQRKTGWKQALTDLANDPEAMATLVVFGQGLASFPNRNIPGGTRFANAALQTLGFRGQLESQRAEAARSQRDFQLRQQEVASQGQLRQSQVELNRAKAQTERRGGAVKPGADQQFAEKLAGALQATQPEKYQNFDQAFLEATNRVKKLGAKPLNRREFWAEIYQSELALNEREDALRAADEITDYVFSPAFDRQTRGQAQPQGQAQTAQQRFAADPQMQEFTLGDQVPGKGWEVRDSSGKLVGWYN